MSMYTNNHAPYTGGGGGDGGEEQSYTEANGSTSLDPSGDYTWTPVATADIDAPGVVKTETEGRAPEKVNTEALGKFVTNMRSLLEPLNGLLAEFEPLVVPAGAFAHAYKLRDDVMGAGGESTSGAVPGTKVFIEKATQALTAVANQAEEMAALYRKTEGDNKADADKLRDALTAAQPYVTGATSA